MINIGDIKNSIESTIQRFLDIGMSLINIGLIDSIENSWYCSRHVYQRYLYRSNSGTG
jgi:hypothetical protein